MDTQGIQTPEPYKSLFASKLPKEGRGITCTQYHGNYLMAYTLDCTFKLFHEW